MRHAVNNHQILELSSPYIQPRLHLFRINFGMTPTLIPIPGNAEFWCNKLFYLHTPIVLTAEEFDTYCTHKYSAYKTQRLYIHHSGIVQRYEPIKKK